MITDYNKKRILAWEQLRDTLFTVDKEGVHPLYVFDLGEHKFPVEYQSKKDFIDRLMPFTRNEDNKLYVSMLKYYQPQDNSIYFSMAATNNEMFLVKFNEKTHDVSVLSLKGKDDGHDYMQQAFFKVIGDKILVSLIDRMKSEENPMIYIMSTSDF